MVKSIADKISQYVAPAIRQAGDFEFILTGTETSVVRIKKETLNAWAGNSSESGKRDIFGDSDERAIGVAVLDNLIIQYNGFDRIEMFGKKPGKKGARVNVKDPEKNIEFYLRLTGDYLKNPVSMSEGDLIVDHFIDEQKQAIPIYLQVGSVFGQFHVKHLVAKSGILVPYQGKMEKSIQEIVEPYLRQIRHRASKL